MPARLMGGRAYEPLSPTEDGNTRDNAGPVIPPWNLWSETRRPADASAYSSERLSLMGVV